MSQNTCGCNCKDYSLSSANTGLAAISTANPYLDGSGTIVALITGVHNGTIIKSITIKATGQVSKGMIRLFIANTSDISLYKEIPIPVTPYTTNTPTPLLVLPTYEYKFEGGGFKLQSGETLSASTQNGDTFNVIVEGLDWVYPALVQTSPLPPLESCCNFKQETASIGLGTASAANPNLDGTGTLVNIFTAGNALSTAKGSFIKSITIKALQNTNPGMLRLFIYDTKDYYLYKEIMIKETIQSGFEPSLKIVLDEDFCLKTGYAIYASTQLAQSFAFTVEGYDWAYPIA